MDSNHPELQDKLQELEFELEVSDTFGYSDVSCVWSRVPMFSPTALKSCLA